MTGRKQLTVADAQQFLTRPRRLPVSTGIKEMNTNQPPYVPISCQFHDLLETIATTRKVVQTIFQIGRAHV